MNAGPKRENFLGVQTKRTMCRLSFHIHAQRAVAAERLQAILLPACLEPSNTITSCGSSFYACKYNLKNGITFIHAGTQWGGKSNTAASPYPRWSDGRIKLVEPFRRMTGEIFPREGGGRPGGHSVAPWGFVAKV